jgi:hypothetical protein
LQEEKPKSIEVTEHKTMVDMFSVNPSNWNVEGNIITDELDDPTLYSLYRSTLDEYIPLFTLPVGDTCIMVNTPGNVTSEGIQESPSTCDVDIGDSIWHSMYLIGSSTVILRSYERDVNGIILKTNNSNPLTLSTTPQLLELNTVIDEGVLINFKVLTNSIQDVTFYLNGVYVNIGATSRTGVNLAPDNVASTGGNGTTLGFYPQPNPSNVIISPLSMVNALEMDYSQVYSKENK